MLIKGVDKQVVEIKIAGYEFPASTDDEYDMNWLRVGVKAKTSLGNWETEDPSLLTWEVKSIAAYFRKLSAFQEGVKELGFIEPNISLILLNDIKDETKKIKILFDVESRPKNAKADIAYCMEFHADSKELERLASELDDELARFPER